MTPLPSVSTKVLSSSEKVGEKVDVPDQAVAQARVHTPSISENTHALWLKASGRNA
ncbi:hypothetical protein RIEGSTA812A_PEG_1233 [invertebrate metagenome]|uniref:Uncharacterized protein n=1 Tax=invertebrate metagenome TaxID=1711999 RepID=A0A484H7Z1_9ZZZZ